MYYPATLTPHNDGTGRYDVTFVDFAGCVSQGGTLEQALERAEEALSLHVSGMRKAGEKIPAASSVEQAKALDEKEALEEGETVEPGTLYQLIKVREDKKEDVKSERLTISLKPAVIERIDAMADEMGLTRSGLIAVATRDYIQRMS